MSLDEYRNALLHVVKKYEDSMGKNLSQRREKDINDLREIIQNVCIASPLNLKQALEMRVGKIRTGWWIFQTGNSRLKAAMLNILNSPTYSPQKIIQDEIRAAEKNLAVLKENANQLNEQIEAREDRLLAQAIQLKLQASLINKKQIYLSYEEHIVNLLDKFVMKRLLHPEETNLLLNVLKDELLGCEPKVRRLIFQKLAYACEFAIHALAKGIDYLINDDQLEKPTFRCLIHFADYYCQSVKPQAGKTCSRFEVLMKKLLHSYHQDGAGRTKVNDLCTQDKSLVLDAKELLICQYGDANLQDSIAPLCELRKESQWSEFKARCIEKGQYLFQWLKDKKSPTRIFKFNHQDLSNADIFAEGEPPTAKRYKL